MIAETQSVFVSRPWRQWQRAIGRTEAKQTVVTPLLPIPEPPKLDPLNGSTTHHPSRILFQVLR